MQGGLVKENILVSISWRHPNKCKGLKAGAAGGVGLLGSLISICIRADDPAFARVPGRQRGAPPARGVPGRTQRYVEESDSDSEASWKEASCKDAATTKVYVGRQIGTRV